LREGCEYVNNLYFFCKNLSTSISFQMSAVQPSPTAANTFAVKEISFALSSVNTEGSKKMYSLFERSYHTGHTDSRIRSAVWRHRRCLAADGGHFEHIQ
jgi:hypothetical protein